MQRRKCHSECTRLSVPRGFRPVLLPFERVVPAKDSWIRVQANPAQWGIERIGEAISFLREGSQFKKEASSRSRLQADEFKKPHSGTRTQDTRSRFRETGVTKSAKETEPKKPDCSRPTIFEKPETAFEKPASSDQKSFSRHKNPNGRMQFPSN